MDLRENVPLAPLTTFKVGGPARYFVEARTEDEVLQAIDAAMQQNLRLFILGGGSNLVVADSGWPGLVLKIAVPGITQKESAGKVLFDAGAGEDWDALVALAVSRNCAGIETLSGIPGTVGGTPVQNVGAYGQEVSETITSVRVLELGRMQPRDMAAAECGFAYRQSIFNSTHKGRFIVLRVTYALTPGGAPRVEYKDLKNVFPDSAARPTLQQVRDAVREIRRSKAMLIVPDDEDCRSAGSFFKNPVVPESKFEEVRAKVAAKQLTPPRYPAAGGMVKLAAAWLVEQSGFPKGFTRGPVAISRKHTLAIVNRGGATAKDILALRDEVRRGVEDSFGVWLEQEPVMVGFDESVAG